jgi:hypothetical protein
VIITYDERQTLKKDENDVGITTTEFVKCVRRLVRISSYDPDTKTIYWYWQYTDGRWEKAPIPNYILEQIAYASRFFGRIPLE